MTDNTIAFFDFDGTLTRHDTLFTFARHSVGKKKLICALIKSLPAIISWKIGMMTNSRAKEILFTHIYKGISYGYLVGKARSFIPVLDKDLNTRGIAALSYHKKLGHTLVIVSASMDFWVLPWAHSHGIDKVIATSPEIAADHTLSGKFATPNCHGAEKAIRIKEVYANRDMSGDYAYGDSSGDEQMLSMVGHPCIINRD